MSLSKGGLSLSRDTDGNRKAKDDGQFGMALRYVSEALGDTEFGLYYMNIHSRTPVVSGIKAQNWVNGLALIPGFMQAGISHKIDMPLQMNATQMLAAALTCMSPHHNWWRM